MRVFFVANTERRCVDVASKVDESGICIRRRDAKEHSGTFMGAENTGKVVRLAFYVPHVYRKFFFLNANEAFMTIGPSSD